MTKPSDSINEYLNALLLSPKMGRQVASRRSFDATPAALGNVAEKFPPVIERILSAQGIAQLYRHQAEAVNLIRERRHVVVATPTASGKTLIYNLAVLEKCSLVMAARALYVFPLKALAQDQLGALNAMIECCDAPRPTAAVYDGDTSQWHRKKIRQAPPNIMITNPEMLHLSLLAHHRKWSSFWRNLQFIVIDEVHTYRGILGCHFAQVVQRLQRICRLYGAKPTYIFSSATIGNPAQLVEQLSGLKVSVVGDCGAPAGLRHVVFMNPDTSPASTAIELLKAALPRGLRTIVYTQSRKMTELIALWAAGRAGKYRQRISAYRAGYLPSERRQIESRLSSGELLAVISTSALELGIDIGHLDLCILVGYPGSIVATRQRGGRVGRSGQDSAIILIAGDDALDQYVLQHPDEIMSGPAEAAVVHPGNPVIAAMHLECAAAELPIGAAEPILQHPDLLAVLRKMETEGRLLRTADGQTIYANRKSPHRKVNLRGGGDRFQIIDAASQQRMGEIDAFRVYRETHPGAVYLHRSESFVVESLDEKKHTVVAAPARVNYFTRVKSHKQTEIINAQKTKNYKHVAFHYGQIKVTDHVYAYEALRIRDRHLLDQVSLDLPPQIFETQALWVTLPEESNRWLKPLSARLLGGIHAVEHAVISMFPLLVMADRNDIGGLATEYHDQSGCATIFIYDGFPGGVGLSRQAFERHRELVDLTVQSLNRCPCETGCPACVQSPRCGNGNRPLDKSLAIQIMMRLQQTMGTDLSDAGSRPNRVTTPVNPESLRDLNSRQSERSDDRPASFGVLDLETQRSAAEVGGWQHADRMKISCGVLYDSRADSYFEYLEDQVPEMIRHIRRLDLIVGFNIKRFDYKVLSAYSRLDFTRIQTLDILEDVHRCLGYRLSLNHLCEITLGQPKSADGLQALRWWKEGRIREIVDYCRDDVRLTRDLYLYGIRQGYLLFRDKAGEVLRVPVEWEGSRQ